MGKKIKTRHINKDIKVLDKTATAAEHMKRSYVRTKNSAEQTQAQEHATPEEYAQDRIAGSADILAHKSASQVKKQGSKIVDTVKEKHRVSKEIKQLKAGIKEGQPVTLSGERSSFSPSGETNLYQPKEERIRQAQLQAGKKAAQQRAGQRASQQISQAREFSSQTVKTLDRGEKTIKTTGRAGQTIKGTGKGTVKAAGKSVKTAERTARTTVKTTEQAVKNAQRTAKATAKTAEKTAKAAEQAAKVAKTTAKAVVNSVKAIIAATKALITAIAAGGWIAILILVIVILFGGFLCMTGGDNSTTVSPVSEEVQAYEPIIRKYAKQYGIEEYVELIKAVMMQESGGKGNDPMQSSEGSFNTKYPRQPNGITDPEYSIDCGVQEIKSCLVSAEVKSPIDMDAIKLALQGYNYGNGYIEWAKTNYGGYTLANAAEFSDKMAKEKGWDSYGDKQYVPHVLRYYSLGRIPNGVGSQAIVQVALTQEGNSGDMYWSWYGFNSRVSWCACFVSWCADQCGYLESGVLPKFSLCSDGVAWFESKGQFKDGSYVPTTGDIIFFDWGNDGSINHVGIVESVNKGTVYTIEGNSGDSVRRQSYPIGDDRIYGYGIY